jgi:transcription antitermination factor NusG
VLPDNSGDRDKELGAPAIIVPERLEVATPTLPWMVLHTKSRQEKAVARFLAASQIRHYLPLAERVNVIRGRKVRSRVPLFPGYVFLCGEREDAYRTMSSGRICQILYVDDQERLAGELAQIRDALARGADLYRCPFAVVGARCRVTKGPFAGITGVVSRDLGDNRLALQVGMLGQGAVLEIDGDLLEPVD